jgi:polar amino acid transport system permease protein
LDVALQSLPFLTKGLLTTLQVSALVVVLSLTLGVLFGLILVYGPLPLRLLVRGYSDLIRGIPILVLIFAVYYGLPALKVNLNSLTAAVTALTMFSTAQVIETTRGAIQSIHHGQAEAGKAIGLTFGQRLVYVVLPQAMRRFLPPWINSVTESVKGSALVSLIGVVDLMLAIQQVIGRVYEPLPLYVLGALIYFAINFSLSSLSRRLERRFAYVRE